MGPEHPEETSMKIEVSMQHLMYQRPPNIRSIIHVQDHMVQPDLTLRHTMPADCSWMTLRADHAVFEDDHVLPYDFDTASKRVVEEYRVEIGE